MVRLVLFPKRNYLIRDCNSHFHCIEGTFSPEELQKESGSQIISSTGHKGSILDASFLDVWQCIKRKAQIMLPKDLGWIVTHTSLDRNKIVVDAGTGSGGSVCFLSFYAKHVYSYDIVDDHIRLGIKNAQFLGLDNVTIKYHDITSSIPHTEVDLIVIDIAQPWDAIDEAWKSLKMGGFLVAYSPSIPQVQQTVVTARTTGLWHLRTIELYEREWVIDHQRCRPSHKGIGHTGFLSLFRKYRAYEKKEKPEALLESSAPSSTEQEK